MHSKIFVIVVTYKGQQWYDKCFDSLLESTIPVQTIVVDNSPGNEDMTYIKEHYPNIHLIKPEENLGFGRANNLGMRCALDNGCDFVFLLNQDTWIEPDTIKKLVAASEKHPEYGILSPMVMRPDEKRIDMILGLNYDNRPLINDLYFGHPAEVYETNYVSACSWLLPRKTMEIIGGFDPIFFHYEEDDNYLRRAVYHKLKIGVCPAARIVHDHHDSLLSDARQKRRARQFLLVEWTDINKAFRVSNILRYYVRKWFSYVISGKYSMARLQCENMRYCAEMRKAVKRSRNENAQRKASWL